MTSPAQSQTKGRVPHPSARLFHEHSYFSIFLKIKKYFKKSDFQQCTPVLTSAVGAAPSPCPVRPVQQKILSAGPWATWWARRPWALLRYGLSHGHQQDQHVLSSPFTPMQGRAGVYQKLAYPPASPPHHTFIFCKTPGPQDPVQSPRCDQVSFQGEKQVRSGCPVHPSPAPPVTPEWTPSPGQLLLQ